MQIKYLYRFFPLHFWHSHLLQVSVLCERKLPLSLVQISAHVHTGCQRLLLPGGPGQHLWGKGSNVSVKGIKGSRGTTGRHLSNPPTQAYTVRLAPRLHLIWMCVGECMNKWCPDGGPSSSCCIQSSAGFIYLKTSRGEWRCKWQRRLLSQMLYLHEKPHLFTDPACNTSY